MVILRLVVVAFTHNTAFHLIQPLRGELMFKKVMLFGLLACVLTAAACSKDDEEPAAPPATTATAPSTVTYGQGFYGLEGTGAASWRWMADQGTLTLKNTGKDMKLHIVGDVPVDSLKGVPTYKITLNGEVLGEVSAKIVDKEFAVPAAKQGATPISQLTISSDKHFVPKDIDPKSTDERKLSFSLRQLTWEAQ
jgi:hypothetical protein